MSEQTGRDGMLNTFYLWSGLVSCSPENVLFLRLSGMTYVKQMLLVKNVSFFHARVDPGVWQQSEVGTGLGGQLPFTKTSQSRLSPRSEENSASLCASCKLKLM